MRASDAAPSEAYTPLSEHVAAGGLLEAPLAAYVASLGGYIAAAEHFDSAFFNVSSAEVAWMDPHQRLVLEVGYQALHTCGWRRRTLNGKALGHFLGMSKADWSRFQFSKRSGTSLWYLSVPHSRSISL